MGRRNPIRNLGSKESQIQNARKAIRGLENSRKISGETRQNLLEGAKKRLKHLMEN